MVIAYKVFRQVAAEAARAERNEWRKMHAECCKVWLFSDKRIAQYIRTRNREVRQQIRDILDLE